MKSQLIICTDMEGVSGIFEENYKAMFMEQMNGGL